MRDPAVSPAAEQAARKVIKPSRPPSLSGRAILNLLLFVALLLALWTGFYRHFKPLFAGVMILGGTIGMWALISFGYGWVKTLVGKEVQSYTVGLFQSARVTEPLVFALFMAVVLQIFTASVYVEHGGGQSDYVIEVLHDDRPFIKPLTVSLDDRMAGRPFLGQFGSPQLTFRINGEPARGTVTKKLNPWSSLRLNVPNDFPVREVTVLRLVAGIALMNCYLPDADHAAPATTYALRIAIGRHTKVLKDFRKGVVYFGGSELDLAWAHEQVDAPQFEAELTSHLVSRRVPESVHALWLRHWTQKPAFLVVAEPTAGQDIVLELVANGNAVVHSQITHVEPDWIGKTHTVFLEVPCPD